MKSVEDTSKNKVGYSWSNDFLFKELFFNQLTNVKLTFWDNARFSIFRSLSLLKKNE